MRFVNKYTHTSPIVFHAPGASRRSRMWGDLQRNAPEFCKTLRQENDPRIAVITWNTDTTESILERCLNAMQHPVTVLGRGKADWCNRDKTKLALDAIQDLDADYIIGLDAWDVALIGHPNEIIDRYKRLFGDMTIAFNGATHPWPAGKDETCLDDVIEREIKTNGLARHLNAGCWIAKRHMAIKFLSIVESIDPESFHPSRRKNEQPRVRLATLKPYFNNIEVDQSCIIFHHCRTEGLTRVE